MLMVKVSSVNKRKKEQQHYGVKQKIVTHNQQKVVANNPHAVHEHLASAAYYKSHPSIHGYHIDKSLSDEETKVYVNKKGKVIVSFRGTTTPEDIITDAEIIGGQRGKRFDKSAEQVRQVIKKYGQENIEVTGHSLGGTIARYISDKFGLKGKAFNPGASPTELTATKESGRNIKTIINAGDPISNSLSFAQNVEIRNSSQTSPHSIEDPFKPSGELKQQFKPITKSQSFNQIEAIDQFKTVTEGPITQAEINEEIAQNARRRPGTQEHEDFRNAMKNQYDEEFRNSQVKPDFEKYVSNENMKRIEEHIMGDRALKAELQKSVKNNQITPEIRSKFQTRFTVVSNNLLSTVGALFVVVSIIGPPLWSFYKEAERIDKEAEKEKTFEQRQECILDKEQDWIKYFNGHSKKIISKETVFKQILKKHTPFIGRPYYTIDETGYKQLLMDEDHYVILENHDQEKNTLFGPSAKIEPIPPGLELLAKPVGIDFGRGLLGTPLGDPNSSYKLCYREQSPGQLRYIMIPTLTEDLQMKENWFRFSFTQKTTAKLQSFNSDLTVNEGSLASLNNYDGWLNDGFNVDKPIGKITIGEWWKENQDKYLLFVASKTQNIPEDEVLPEPMNLQSELNEADFTIFLETASNDPQTVVDYISKWSNAAQLLKIYQQWRYDKGFPKEQTNNQLSNILANEPVGVSAIAETAGAEVLPQGSIFSVLYKNQDIIFEKQFH
jgi:hypothetical protein